MNTTEKLMGIYHDSLYRDSESGFSIFRLRPQLSKTLSNKLKNGLITCKGCFPSLDHNLPMELTGIWESSKYGWTFQVKSYTEKSYSRMHTIDFLCSIKGIGDATAERIADLMPDFFEDVKKPGAAMVLAMNAKISKEKAEKLISQVVSQQSKRETMEFLFKHGGRMPSVEKLYANYGNEGVMKIKKSPYDIGDKIGLPLSVCDSIAFSEGFNVKSSDRICAYIRKYLQGQMTSGHMFTTEFELAENILKQINQGVENKISPMSLTTSLRHSKSIECEYAEKCTRVYLKYLKAAEDKLAEQVFRLQTSSSPTVYKDEYLDDVEQLYAADIPGFTFAPEQRGAFNLLKQTGIGILTGGPGTGKTTTVKGIIDAYIKMYPENKVKLCAPTGRAAQRMTESTGRPSTTIHRLLEYRPFEGDSNDIQCKNEFDPIDADLIVVDEVSMLDCQLASLFFTAVKTGTLVIMVGDINQLQSVGAGDVLNDFINSKRIPVERLIKTYRQAEGSYIIHNATEINYGHSILKTGDDFEIYQTTNVSEKIVEIIKQYHTAENPFYVQVLSPTHNGDGGVKDINSTLQEVLNPGNKPTLIYGKSRFKLHDKILMTKNNPEKGYFNGDVGVIIGVGEDSLTIKIQESEIVLEHSNLGDVTLSYSMTIHKSQGSEFPITIISLPNVNSLKRNLLYTAVTRAKGKVIIVQQPGAIAASVSRNEVGKRNTTLIERLDSLF